MAGGYTVPPEGQLGELVRALDDARRRLAELERPTGTQLAEAVKALQVAQEQLEALILDLQQQVDDLLAVAVNTGDVNATGNIDAGGTVTAGGDITTPGTVTGTTGLTSEGVYNLDVTTLPGGRAAVWVHVSGQLGQTVSTIVKKTDLDDVPFTASDVLKVAPHIYHYRAQIDIRDNPDNPFHDPEYVVPWEVGLMAEHLIDNNLGLFVVYEPDGTPAGINYDLFGAVASLVIGRDHEARIAALEATA